MMMVNEHGEVHGKTALCEDYNCRPSGEDEVKPDVTEFTIEVSYWNGGQRGDYRKGWRYRLSYQHPKRPIGPSVETSYGFDNEIAAKKAAEERATEIAKALLPVVSYKFTPKLEDLT